MFCGKIEENHICKDCIKIVKNEEKTTVLDDNAYLFEYKDKLRDKIIEYKFDDKPYLYKDFAYLFINNQKICDFLKSYDIITAVPMYYKKQIMRGYNQAEEFGDALSRYSGIKADSDILLRVKNTKPQKGLNKEQRKVNLADAFAVNKEKIKNAENILLVDDVYTTGSTMDTLAKLLKKAGAGKVYFMCIATGKR